MARSDIPFEWMEGCGMRRLVMAMGIFAALASLTACKKVFVDDTSALQNPPPKPPNCPNLPELQNVTLKNGTIADVRIIRDGDDTFYIPFSWFEWEANQKSHPAKYWKELKDSPTLQIAADRKDIRSSTITGYDIERIECPGVVHEREFQSYKTPFVKIRIYDGERSIPPNFSVDSEIEQVTFYKIYPERPGYKQKIEEGRIDEDIETSGVGYEAYVRVGERHLARYPIYGVDKLLGVDSWGVGAEREAFRKRVMALESWRLKRDSVKEFFNWLKIPPKDRDNNRIFKLGAKDQ
jgi:hypothetical protein